MSMRSSNPVLGEDTFEKYARNGAFGGGQAMQQAQTMTVEGTVNKTAILLLLAVISAGFTWNQVLSGDGRLVMPLAIGGAIGGFIVAMVTIFKPSVSRITAPIYAVLEGLFLGAFSAIINEQFANATYRGMPLGGIVPQAVGLTFGTFAVLLLAYRSGLIQVTDKLRMGIVAATGGVFLFALARIIFGAFGNHSMTNMMWSGSPLAIGISLVIVVIAAMNLVLDFDLVERGVRARAPKFMEWYCGFSLMVTLVWLYMTILRLLANLNRR